ncbi:MAG: cadherin domain-containing protein, partial [Sphingomonadales bacterium]|nr:cadherin domain-containing protein [Sphingomonadales bacterium]
AQQIDNILVTHNLLTNASYDSVHINSQFAPTDRPTDHDPQVAIFRFGAPPTDLALSNATVAENLPAGTVVGTLSAHDSAGDTLTYALTNDAGGLYVVDAATGVVTTTAAFDHEAVASYAITGLVTDQTGLSASAGFTIAVADVNEAPTGLALSNAAIAENLPAGTIVGTLSAGDPDHDTLTYSLTDDAGGRFAVDAVTGVVTTTAALDHEAAAAYAIAGQATDSAGLHVNAGFTVTVTDLNEAPVAVHDSAAVNEDATSANLWAGLLANDHDPDAGDSLRITAIDSSGTLGSLIFDPAHQILQYVADNDAFDALAPGQQAIDHFTYTVTDAAGLTSTAIVDMVVTGIDDGVTLHTGLFGGTLNGGSGEDRLYGSLGSDTLNGMSGHDYLFGGLGNDKLNGGDGNDVLFGDLGSDTLNGGAGVDELFGGLGDDMLTGGTGADLFHFGRAGGSDTITDFNTNDDRIILDDDLAVIKSKVADVNHDGTKDLTLTFNQGTSVTLLGVSDASKIKYAAPDYYSDHQPGLGGVLDDIGDALHGLLTHQLQLQDGLHIL